MHRTQDAIYESCFCLPTLSYTKEKNPSKNWSKTVYPHIQPVSFLSPSFVRVRQVYQQHEKNFVKFTVHKKFFIDKKIIKHIFIDIF